MHLEIKKRVNHSPRSHRYCSKTYESMKEAEVADAKWTIDKTVKSMEAHNELCYSLTDKEDLKKLSKIGACADQILESM